MVIAILISIPLGLIFRFIKGSFLRHLYGMILGAFLQYMVYRNSVISVYVQNLIVYLLCTLKTRHIGKIVTIESIIFLSAHHIYRQIYDYGGYNLDITTILMCNTVKWCSFGYSI